MALKMRGRDISPGRREFTAENWSLKQQELSILSGGALGTKSSEDDFALIRQDTGMLCEDFSEKIGEELFQIDGEGFSRTVFLSQNDCQTETTGSINAKIGNLAENTDDINNFESADKRLGDLLNTLTPSRKTGKLSKMKSRLTELSSEIGRKGELEGSIQRLSRNAEGLRGKQGKAGAGAERAF